MRLGRPESDSLFAPITYAPSGETAGTPSSLEYRLGFPAKNRSGNPIVRPSSFC
jgi:hypothetical protein